MSFLLCGFGRKKAKKKNRKAEQKEWDRSFKYTVERRAEESAVFKTVIADNSRLTHENETLRKELEYFRASLRANSHQDEELAANIGLTWNVEKGWKPTTCHDSTALDQREASNTENNQPPSLPKTRLPTTTGMAGEPARATTAEGEVRLDERRQSEGEIQLSTPALRVISPEAGSRHAVDTGAGGNIDSESDGDDSPEGKARHVGSGRNATSPKAVTDTDGDFPAPRQETQGPDEELRLQAGVVSPHPLLLRLPSKLTSTVPDDLRFVDFDFSDKFKDLRENFRRQGDKTAQMLEKHTAELRSGQRKLLDLAQSTHAGMAALEEVLTSARRSPDPLAPQASRLPPHVAGLGLAIQDKFVTTATVKEFFRLLRMDPGKVEELAASAYDGPSGSRDLFWSLLVTHNHDLSEEGQTINMADILDACETLGISTWQCSVMPREHRQILEKKMLDLVRTLHVDLLLPHLTSAGIMTSSAIRDYVMEGATPQRVMKLLDILPLLGENALDVLVLALQETGQEHVAHIILSGKENVTVEAQSKPPNRGRNSASQAASLTRDCRCDVMRPRRPYSMFADNESLPVSNEMLMKEIAAIKCSVKNLESKIP